MIVAVMAGDLGVGVLGGGWAWACNEPWENTAASLANFVSSLLAISRSTDEEAGWPSSSLAKVLACSWRCEEDAPETRALV